MKSILYVGATLMIGASIYGFVDYKQTSQKKEFTSMYAEEKAADLVSFTSNEESKPALNTSNKVTETIQKKESITVVNKPVTKKRAFSKEEPGKSIRPIAENEKIETREVKKIETPASAIKVAEESGIEKNIVKKRKFSTKLFSRSALDERYIEPKKSRKIKTDTNKTE